MSLTINDPTTLSTFSVAVGSGLEVRGPDGQLLGYFNPAPRPGMEFPELGMSLADMERRRTDPKAVWVTGEQVMARLRSLGDAK